MVVAEALVLLTMGLLLGIVSTVFDVLLLGTASFLSHFSLWVLLNALMAVHVDSRLKAIWWAIPYNLGYIEGYFITTVASFESYPKKLMVPLAAIALISPFLTYALWTAKREKNLYGKVLSVLIVACTLVASFVVNAGIGIYDVIMCSVLAYVLIAMPVRRLKITRSARETVPLAAGEQPMASEGPGRLEQSDQPEQKKRTRRFRRVKSESSEPERDSSRLRPTRRKRTKQKQEKREEQLQAETPERRPRRRRRVREEVPEEAIPTMQTLGNSRTAHRSSRRA